LAGFVHWWSSPRERIAVRLPVTKPPGVLAGGARFEPPRACCAEDDAHSPPAEKTCSKPGSFFLSRGGSFLASARASWKRVGEMGGPKALPTALGAGARGVAGQRESGILRECLGSDVGFGFITRWTPQNRPPRRRPETGEYLPRGLVASSWRKLEWTLVRQLRGPYLRTCAG
jgi:hypothetical protein